jgi:hypothetical protein
LVESISVPSRARVVACLELGAGAFLLSKVFQKKPLEDRIPPLGALCSFFLYSTIGHAVVGDHVVPVAATMLLCASLALSAILLQKDNATNLKGE